YVCNRITGLSGRFPPSLPCVTAPQRQAHLKASKMTDKTLETLAEKLDRLIEVVGRMAPAAPQPTDLAAADCFVWSAEQGLLEPVSRVNRVDIGLIRGVDRVRDILI